ncbi:BgTH12-00447 [Blumeria graminis f. sp. triticale]|uniref:BgTH12-00447 n=1 Tax=Blumeria graminis f. sp. triticale TaxID=1689686 RepID=A0A9W4D609_BLUGR|nr:BgTH12-00447 [Blumeria graminis f. sp. triticale]
MKDCCRISENTHKNWAIISGASRHSVTSEILSSKCKKVSEGAIRMLQISRENIKVARETSPQFSTTTPQIKKTLLNDKKKRKRKRARNKNKIQNIRKEFKENEQLVDGRQQMIATPSQKPANPIDRKKKLLTKSVPNGMLNPLGTTAQNSNVKIGKAPRKLAVSKVRKAKSTTIKLGERKKDSKFSSTIGPKIDIIFKSDANQKSASSDKQIEKIQESCNTLTRFKQKRLRKRLKKTLFQSNLKSD